MPCRLRPRVGWSVLQDRLTTRTNDLGVTLSRSSYGVTFSLCSDKTPVQPASWVTLWTGDMGDTISGDTSDDNVSSTSACHLL